MYHKVKLLRDWLKGEEDSVFSLDGKKWGRGAHLNVGTCLAFLSSSFVRFSWKRVFMGNSEHACCRQMCLDSGPHLVKNVPAGRWTTIFFFMLNLILWRQREEMHVKILLVIMGKSFTTNHPPVPLKPIKVTQEFERIVFGLYCVQDLICCTLKALH